jgi:hypothetical protein
VLVAVVAGCGSGATHVVRVTGEIGPLHMDRSGEAAVVGFAGKPDATRVGTAVGGYAPYRALGYDCVRGRSDVAMQIVAHGPYCRTIFFLDDRTGKLETFFTSSPTYSETHGVRFGMKQAEAERRLHLRLTTGCTAAFHFESPTGSLSIEFSDGSLNGTAIKGSHVDAIVVHSKRRDAGVFDCI